MFVPDRKYALTDKPGRFGLSCTEAGLRLAGVPLLTRGEAGFRPRPIPEIRELIWRAYGPHVRPRFIVNGLEVVARALNDGLITRAMIAAIQLKLPDLDWEGAARLARAPRPDREVRSISAARRSGAVGYPKRGEPDAWLPASLCLSDDGMQPFQSQLLEGAGLEWPSA